MIQLFAALVDMPNQDKDIIREPIFNDGLWNVLIAMLNDNSLSARNIVQNCGLVHPYTCGNDDCRAVLRAVEDGWICDKCDYTQKIDD